MAGHYGCDRGSHSTCGLLSGSELDITLLNIDSFFGIRQKTKLNVLEAQQKMVEYYQERDKSVRRQMRDLTLDSSPSAERTRLEAYLVSQLEEAMTNLDNVRQNPLVALSMYIDIEFAKRSAERNDIMARHQNALESILRILNESRLDEAEY
jgi:hypothetical protein